MEYVINGIGTYTPDPSYVNFRRIEHLFEKKAEAACQEYVRYHIEHFQNYDQFIEGANNAAHQIFYRVIDQAVEELVRHEVYGVSSEQFLTNYVSRVGITDWEEAYAAAEARYRGVWEEEEEVRQHREERKENRGRAVATIRGSDSLGDVVGNYIGTELLNYGAGMVHSYFNARQNLKTRASSENKKAELFNDDIRIEMAVAVYICVERFKYAFMDALSEHTDQVFSEPSAGEYDRVEGMMQNLLDGIIPEEKRADVLREVLAIDPLNKTFMKYILKTSGDADGSYRALCETLSFDIDEVKKQLLLEDFSGGQAQITTRAAFYGVEEKELSGLSLYRQDEIADRLRAVNYDSREAFRKDTKDFLAWAHAGILDTKPYEEAFRKIDRILGKTVDGHTYPSKKKAQESAVFLENLCKRINATSGNDVAAIEDMLEGLEATEVLSKEKYITFLKEELDMENRRFCHVKGTDYTDRAVAQQARKDAVYLDDLFRDASFADKGCVEDLLSKAGNIASPDLKEVYTSFLEMCRAMVDEQSAAILTPAQTAYPTRRQAAAVFYPEWARRRKAEHIRALLPEYGQWFDDLYRHYVNVMQPCATPQDADKAYYRMIGHARTYLNYMNEKQTGNTIMSRLKTGITGVVYEGYKKDFDAATKHGLREIPMDNLSEDQKAVEELASAALIAAETFQTEVADRYSGIPLSAAMEERQMRADGLYLGTKTDRETVNEILRETIGFDLTNGLQQGVM